MSRFNHRTAHVPASQVLPPRRSRQTHRHRPALRPRPRILHLRVLQKNYRRTRRPPDRTGYRPMRCLFLITGAACLIAVILDRKTPACAGLLFSVVTTACWADGFSPRTCGYYPPTATHQAAIKPDSAPHL
jgi:hypothetical protein